MKNPYENPAVFEARTPKTQEDKIEELRRGMLKEQSRKKPWKHKYFVIIAIILLIIFIATIFLARA